MRKNPADGSAMRVYASGLRNPGGYRLGAGYINAGVAVNERDELGDNLVPDYLTGIRENGFTYSPCLLRTAYR